MPVRFATASCIALAILTAACDDPSSAGLEFVDDDEARPTVAVENPTVVESESGIREETGQAPRVLTGTVSDPISGTVSGTGYLDFSEPADPPSVFRNGPVTEVELRLVRSYVYGDTLSAGMLTLNNMDETWTSTGVAADSQLTSGGEAMTIAFATSDTVVSVPLPQAWIDEYGDRLSAAGSDTLFHGFELVSTGTNAVVGYASSSAVLRVVSGGETIEFPVNRQLTTVQRLTSPSVPADRLLIQDTAGPGVAIGFDLSDNELDTAILNRGEIHVTVDTLSMGDEGSFVRPRVQELMLQAVTSNDGVVVLGVADVENGAAVFSGDLVRVALQGLASGAGVVDRFRVIVDVDEHGIGYVVLNGLATEGHPFAKITASKLQ